MPVRPTAFWGCLLSTGFVLAACAGSRTTAVSAAASGPIIISPFEYVPDNDTGSTGAIAAPAAAIWGTVAPQPATTANPSLFGGPVPAGTSFPVLATGLQFAATSVGPVAIGQGASAIVIGAVTDNMGQPGTNFQLVIPGANINATITAWHQSLDSGEFDSGIVGSDYLILGAWGGRGYAVGGDLTQSGPVSEFLFGFETPAASVPATGQASYSGGFGVNGAVYAPIGGHVMDASLQGKANFTADFSSGRLTGAFSEMRYTETCTGPSACVGGPWNDVSLSASILAGTARFSGSTAAASVPSGAFFSLSGSANGHIDGAFFGPSAREIGAVWTLSDGTTSAIGWVNAALPR